MFAVQATTDNTTHLKNTEILVEKIQDADAVVVGAGSGLSSAAGYNHYHWTPAMERFLKDFKAYYGFSSPFSGFYHCYSSPEQQWAYYAGYINAMYSVPTGQPYLDLRELLNGKDYFILTTNVDMQCERVFPAEKICDYQGSMGYFQCSQPCHDRIYENRDSILQMNRAVQGVTLPPDLVPRCPECGRIMVPWVRDDTFLEGNVWKEAVKRYEDFLAKYLIRQPEKKVLLLELGVGEMTPGVIKLPFWSMTEKNPQVFYACLNKKPSSAPEHLRGRSLYIAGDLSETLKLLKAALR